MSTNPHPTWNSLVNISDSRLFEARAQLHQAVQLLTAIAISYLKPRPDDSHTAMLWSPESASFLSQPFGDSDAFQLSLNPADLSCTVFHSGAELINMKLSGNTLEQVARDLQFFLEDQGLPRDVFTMNRHFELPDYPHRWDLAFDTSDDAGFRVLQLCYANAHGLITEIADADKRASAVLTWPHHFDMATLISLGDGKSIGLGLSPGDASYTSPYHYVNVWPYPSQEQLETFSLSKGKWHTEGWTGMVLTFDQIVSVTGPANQEVMVKTFLHEAMSHSEAITQLNKEGE